MEANATLRAVHEDLLARIEVLAGATIISFSSVMVKVAHVGPATAGFYRMLFGSLALLAVVLLRRERLWAGGPAFWAAASAGLAFFLGLVFWHHSIHYIGPGLSTIFANLQVLVVAVGAALIFKEKPTWRLAAAVPLALGGLFLIVGPGWSGLGSDDKIGIWLGLSAALWYGSFLIIMRESSGFERKYAQLTNITVASVFSALFMVIEVLRQGEGFGIPDALSLKALLVLGLICHAVGWWLIITGMPKIPLSVVGLSILLQPTGAFIWDMLFFNRPTTSLEIVGAALALGGIYLGSMSGRRGGHQNGTG